MLFAAHVLDLQTIQRLLQMVYFDHQSGAVAGICAGAIMFMSFLLARLIYGSHRRERTIAFENPNGGVTVSLTALEDLIKRLMGQMPEIKEIRDTQNGFKGFWKDLLLEILPRTMIRGAIFDVELIYLSKIFGKRNGVKEFGMPWVDTPGMSNFSYKAGLKM